MAKNLAKKSTTTALANWDEELRKEAKAASDAEQAPVGSFVSIRGGALSIEGQPIKGNEIDVIIIDHIFENAYYTGKFDPDTPAAPVCFAFGRNDEEMGPHDKSTDPQHEKCEGCEQNAFGSADTGRGKACKNQRRLALLSADGLSAKSIKDGTVKYLRVPPTSVKGWAYYVKGLAATAGLPPWAVVTKIGVVPDPKTQVRVTFELVQPVDKDVLGALKAKKEEIMQQIDFPYQPAPEKPVQISKPKGKRKF